MMYYIVCYDISANKHRRRVHKYLQKHGKQVQESVFEIYIRQEKALLKLTKQLNQSMADGDSIRIYHFPENARQRSHSLDGKCIAYFPAAMII